MSFTHFNLRLVGFTEIEQNLAQAHSWVPQYVDQNMKFLAERLARIMQMSLRSHRYRGELEDSVRGEYNPATGTLEVGPVAKRGGRFDAGTILEMGTGPIPNVPFRPIRLWAEKRGLPAGPVWLKIRMTGVTGHPWMEEFLFRGDTRIAVENTAKRLALMIAVRAVQVQGGAGGTIEGLIPGGG